MSTILGTIFGESIASTVNAVGDQINKKAELETQSDSNQVEINKAEASTSNLFIAGWRPFCGWICSLSLAYHALLQPFIIFIFQLFGKTIPMPSFDESTLTNILYGLLGLGTLRTIEKLKK